MKAICTYIECTKVITNNQDIRSSVTIKALFANISWTCYNLKSLEWDKGQTLILEKT